jgi:hypothetical protein
MPRPPTPFNASRSAAPHAAPFAALLAAAEAAGLGAERRARLEAALTAFAGGPSFHYYLEEPRFQRSFDAIVRYLLGVAPDFVAEHFMADEAFEIAEALLGPLSRWDAVDDRVVALHFDRRMAGARAPDDQVAYRTTRLFDRLETCLRDEPDFDGFARATEALVRCGQPADLLEASRYAHLARGLVSEAGRPTSLGRRILARFEVAPETELAEAHRHQSLTALATLVATAPALFEAHAERFVATAIEAEAPLGLARLLLRLDPRRWEEAIWRLAGAAKRAETRWALARDLADPYPERAEAVRDLALGVLPFNDEWLWEKRDVALDWIVARWPDDALARLSAHVPDWPSERHWQARLLLDRLGARALPFALACLTRRPAAKAIEARRWRAHVDEMFALLAGQDLAPHRATIAAAFAAKGVHKSAREAAHRHLDRLAGITPAPKPPRGKSLSGCYRLDQYGRAAAEVWTAELLAARDDLPTPIAAIEAGRRDEELEIGVLTVIAADGRRREVPVGVSGFDAIPAHVDELDDDERPGGKHRLLFALLRRFHLDPRELEEDLGWERGLLALLRERELFACLEAAVSALRAAGVPCAEIVQLGFSDGEDDARAADAMAYQEAIGRALRPLGGRADLLAELAALVYRGREHRAWLQAVAAAAP